MRSPHADAAPQTIPPFDPDDVPTNYVVPSGTAPSSIFPYMPKLPGMSFVMPVAPDPNKPVDPGPVDPGKEPQAVAAASATSKVMIASAGVTSIVLGTLLSRVMR